MSHFAEDFGNLNSPLHPPLMALVRRQLPPAAKGAFEYVSEPYSSGEDGNYRVDIRWGTPKKWQPVTFTVIDLIREVARCNA